MQFKKFMYFALDRKRIRFINQRQSVYIEFIKHLTEYIDYKCDCYKHKRPMGCCNGCEFTIGYLESLPRDPYKIEQIAALFHYKNGFWRKDKGCVLPRKWRSETCLLASCLPDKHFDNKPVSGEIINIISSYRCYTDQHSTQRTIKIIMDTDFCEEANITCSEMCDIRIDALSEDTYCNEPHVKRIAEIIRRENNL